MIGTTVRSHAHIHGAPYADSTVFLSLPQLSIISMSLLAVHGVEDITLHAVWGVLQAVIPALLMNICVVGFNQLCDIDIDRARIAALPRA